MKVVADTASAGAVFGAFLGIFPPLAAFGALIWYMIQIFESDTVQHWLHRHKVLTARRRKRRSKRKPEPLD